MNDLPGKDLERLKQDAPPMTALTLSTGLNEAELDLGSVTLSVEQMDDHALLEATRTGDETAFQELVRRYRNPITNFVYRMLNDYDRAVDLAQETFVRVYMSAERYQANYSFSTYIYRIASNLAISDLRQRKRRRLVPIPSFFSDKDGTEMEVELPDERQIMPDEAMIEDERRRAVSRAIASLPEKYRAAVVLRDIEGKSYEEISAVLGLSDGTVKSRINRARNLLKEKLRDYL
jgi:RNA polymerase sigma-70 factor (ECF subfamily)